MAVKFFIEMKIFFQNMFSLGIFFIFLNRILQRMNRIWVRLMSVLRHKIKNKNKNIDLCAVNECSKTQDKE